MTDTIELFPGVQFRKDMTKPLGNRWMFLHEGVWLIAKLAYSDDLFLDHVAEVIRQRDELAVSLAGYKQGARVEAEAADEARAEIRALKARLAEHEAADDIPDFSPGNGNKARRRAAAVGIDMDASLKAGALIAAPPPRPWKEIAEPVADADRKCHEPDCWNCEGTGRDPSGSICVLNGGLPF